MKRRKKFQRSPFPQMLILSALSPCHLVTLSSNAHLVLMEVPEPGQGVLKDTGGGGGGDRDLGAKLSWKYISGDIEHRANWQLSFKFQRILSGSFSSVQNLSVVGHT